MTCLTDLTRALAQRVHEYLTIDWYLSCSSWRKIQFRIDFRLELPNGLRETDVSLWVTTGKGETWPRGGGAGLSIAVLYSGKGKSTRELGFVAMQRGKACGEQTLASLHLAKDILISASTTTQCLLSAGPALRPWNITCVTDFILIPTGTHYNVTVLFTFYKPLRRAHREAGWQVNVQNHLEPSVFCTQPKQNPACAIYSCEIQMELIQLVCAYSYRRFRKKYF